MDSSSFITVSHESSIMTSSESHRPRRWGIWIALITLSALLIGSLILIIGLSPAIPAPNRPALLVATTPARLANKLSLNDQQLLPETWRAAVRTKSHWPILFGITREDDRWNGFVIGPSWVIKQTSNDLFYLKYRFVARLSETALEDGSSTLRYPKSLGMLMRHPTSAFVAKIFSTSDQLQDFTAFERDGLIETDLAFEQSIPTQPLKRTDLSLNVSSIPLSNMLLNEWSIGPMSLTDLPEKPTQINILLDENNKPLQSNIVFSQLLEPQARAQVLVRFGIGELQTITLPDNTVSYERRPLSTVQDPFTTTTNFGTVTWNDNQLIVGTIQQVSQPLNTPCQSFTPILHLSSRLLSQLIGQNQAFPSINLGAKDNKLALCIEK